MGIFRRAVRAGQRDDGNSLLDIHDLLDMNPHVVEATREFQQSRMGVYDLYDKSSTR